MRIAVDAMGGDAAPEAPVRGALEAAGPGAGELEVLLVGDPELLGEYVDGREGEGRFRIVEAPDRVEPGEPPALAVRRKPRSSIVVGLQLVADGEADAFVSAGPTGAVMAGSVLVLGGLPGVDRPAVAAVVPTAASPTLLLDAGANVSCRPRHLHQFARLGRVYLQDLLDTPDPRIGLLNVGEEEEKGDDLVRAAHRLLREDPELNFVGNVEGNRIIEGVCDVLVCDGFVGNVVLKFYESIAGHVVGLLEEHAGESRAYRRIRKVLDYAEYGGAPLLGVGGVSVICHGASPPRAIRNAVGAAARAVEADMVEHLARALPRS